MNQLLTKIDGVDALNNILLIGMTNRKDMLDEAMLRPRTFRGSHRNRFAGREGSHTNLEHSLESHERE